MTQKQYKQISSKFLRELKRLLILQHRKIKVSRLNNQLNYSQFKKGWC